MKALLVGISLLMLSGCVSLPKVEDPSLLSQVKSVSLDREVVISAKRPFVQTPGQVWGMAIGGAAGGAMMASSASNREQYEAFLKEKDIDLKDIVHRSFKSSLKDKLGTRFAENGSAEASVALDISFYGIHGAGPFSLSKMEPMLDVTAVARHVSGEIVWASRESIRFPTEQDVKPYTLDEYAQNPKLLADGYAALSDKISSLLIENLSVGLVGISRRE